MSKEAGPVVGDVFSGGVLVLLRRTVSGHGCLCVPVRSLEAHGAEQPYILYLQCTTCTNAALRGKESILALYVLRLAFAARPHLTVGEWRAWCLSGVCVRLRTADTACIFVDYAPLQIYIEKKSYFTNKCSLVLLHTA